MSGKMSRRKGSRVEYLVRDAFRLEGWVANRVPLSGSAQGFKGDVVVSKDGRDLVIEVKARATSFDRIYKLYFECIKSDHDDLVQFVHDGDCIAMSTSLSGILEQGGVYNWVESAGNYKDYKQTYKKIANMKALLQGADLLVIKGNNKPLLYIRYR